VGLAGALPGGRAVAGEAESPVLLLNDGGQFVFWQFGLAQAGDVFTTVKIAWLYNPVGVDRNAGAEWTSFIPALGTTNFAVAGGGVLWIVSEGAQEIPIGGGGGAAVVEFDFTALSKSEIEKLVEPQLADGEEVLSAHFAFAWFEIPSKPDTIVVLTNRNTELSLSLLLLGGDGKSEAQLTTLATLSSVDRIETFALFEFVDVLFVDVNGDERPEVIVLATYITGIGPTGAVPFQSNSVLAWTGQDIVRLPEVEDTINGLESTDAVRDALGVK
jgi:hypothetical protein